MRVAIFSPKNSFSYPLAEYYLYKILEKKLLKPNCIIPIADFFLRKMRDFFPEKGIVELKKILKQR